MLFSSDRSESLLYSYFHEFHSEIVRIKELILSKQWTVLNMTEDEQPTSMPFQQQLISLLERQSINAAQRGGEQGARMYREAQYLMVAYADEFFLHLLNWKGQEAWRGTQLLEVKMFNSQASGERVFDNLKILLKQRDPITLELARLYLIVLGLDFQGQYRNKDDAGQLQNYRRQLFFFITQRDPSELDDYLHYDTNKRLCPDAYAYTLKASKEKQRWLPSLYKWYILLIVIGIGLLISSSVLWHAASQDLDTITSNILLFHK
ncbi:MAG: DotU family type IV/VI secretion system protein [Candidatus Parabeggiatoa sp.]|nr:DotU family type IV/VI secretion system protein [Candidatus Parabeggiatoa sp.]